MVRHDFRYMKDKYKTGLIIFSVVAHSCVGGNEVFGMTLC